MYEISSEASFSASHKLINYNGPCENLHGHNWLVRAIVRCEKLDNVGIGIDFKILKGTLKAIVDELDHTDINTVFMGPEMNPSSENIAKWIFDQLKSRINVANVLVYRVDVYETPGNGASYFE